MPGGPPEKLIWPLVSVGSGKSGTPWERMHAVNCWAWASALIGAVVVVAGSVVDVEGAVVAGVVVLVEVEGAIEVVVVLVDSAALVVVVERASCELEQAASDNPATARAMTGSPRQRWRFAAPWSRQPASSPRGCADGSV